MPSESLMAASSAVSHSAHIDASAVWRKMVLGQGLSESKPTDLKIVWDAFPAPSAFIWRFANICAWAARCSSVYLLLADDRAISWYFLPESSFKRSIFSFMSFNSFSIEALHFLFALYFLWRPLYRGRLEMHVRQYPIWCLVLRLSHFKQYNSLLFGFTNGRPYKW